MLLYIILLGSRHAVPISVKVQTWTCPGKRQGSVKIWSFSFFFNIFLVGTTFCVVCFLMFSLMLFITVRSFCWIRSVRVSWVSRQSKSAGRFRPFKDMGGELTHRSLGVNKHGNGKARVLICIYICTYVYIYISGVYGTIIYKWWFVSLLCKSVCLFHVTVLVPLCPCWLLTNSEKELVAIAITCWYVCIIAAHYPTLCKTLPSNAHKICAFCILYDPKYIHQKSYFALYWWICFCLLVVFDSYATYITVYIWLYAYYVYKILLKLHLYILLHV